MKKVISNSYTEIVATLEVSLCRAADQGDFDRLKYAFAECFATLAELALEL